jgi:hypothetical protein
VVAKDDVVLSPKNAIPTRTDVNDALDELHQLTDTGEPNDWETTRLYIYGSGHGIATVPRESVLLMANAGEKRLGENIAYDKYLNFYEEAKLFREVIVFADCCRYKRSCPELSPPPFNKPEKFDEERPKVRTLKGYATSFGDPAFPDTKDVPPDQRRSIFTRALLEGLRGAAKAQGMGQIDSDSLKNYVEGRVGELTSYKQQPEMEASGNIILLPSDDGTILQHRVRICFPVGFGGIVYLKNGDLDILHKRNITSHIWAVNLPNGYYQIHPEGDLLGRTFREYGRFKVLGEERDIQL